jgi:uncharacterized membrane protein
MLNIQEKNIHKIFTWSLIIKGFDSILEIFGGILLLFPGLWAGALTVLTQNELIEDPNDFLANQIQHLLPYFSGHAQLFGVFYLLSHGLVKLFLVVSLLRNRLWAYPAMIWVLILFVIYQLYRMTYAQSIFLIALTLFDVFIIILTWHEYRLVKKHLPLK